MVSEDIKKTLSEDRAIGLLGQLFKVVTTAPINKPGGRILKFNSGHFKTMRLDFWEHFNAQLRENNIVEIPPLLKDELHLITPKNLSKIDGHHILWQFHGKEYPDALLKSANHIFRADLRAGLLIVSPETLSKSYRKKESDMVQLAHEHFKNVGFIKLPWTELHQALIYARQNRFSLIVIPEIKKSLIQKFLKSADTADKKLFNTMILLYPDMT